ncbi:hypothetical protein [Stackebrandtia albiflava]|nr:hypothetical protein [Stackebrandtia albiflava]
MELSERARSFLRVSSRRVNFERGLTGQSLQREIIKVYGRPNDVMVNLLDRIQERYGGLSYKSGFFDSPVTFAPVCDPEDPGDDVEILYAVETGSPLGASVKLDGEVEVGIDFLGIREFSDLDSLIECDAMFSAAEALGEGAQRYMRRNTARAAVDALRVDQELGLKLVPTACGYHTFWLASDSTMVYATDIWSMLNGIMPPLLKVWTTSAGADERITRIVGSFA